MSGRNKNNFTSMNNSCLGLKSMFFFSKLYFIQIILSYSIKNSKQIMKITRHNGEHIF